MTPMSDTRRNEIDQWANGIAKHHGGEVVMRVVRELQEEITRLRDLVRQKESQ